MLWPAIRPNGLCQLTLLGDVHFCAIAKALGKEPKDLLWPLLTTINGHGKAAATTLELTDIGDGCAIPAADRLSLRIVRGPDEGRGDRSGPTARSWLPIAS
jgi:hypothetical protein